MAPTSDQPGGAPKKSLRIWVRNNGHMMRKKTCAKYVYPRTVEAAKDPFECATGKNKMFFLIAINLFPDSKIVRPDDTDSETEMEATTESDMKSAIGTEEPVSKSEVTPTKLDKKGKRKASSLSPPPATLAPQKVSESLKSQTNGNTEVVRSSQLVPVTTPAKRKIAKSKSSSPKARSPAAKKSRIRSANSNNVENKEECSKATKMMISDDCLSTSNAEMLQPNQSTNKIKAPDVATIKAPIVYARKSSPSAIPTIINSFHKVIQNCSTTGVVSFSLSKKPRQSRS